MAFNLTQLTNRVESVEKRLSAIETQAQQQPEPETWRLWMQVRSKTLFRSNHGRLEVVPSALLDLIAGQMAFDGEVVAGKNGFAEFFGADGKRLCRIPASLAAVLDGEHLLRDYHHER